MRVMRRCLALALLLSTACVALTATGAQAAEYVYNGNFSSNTAGWNWPTQMGTENCCANPPGGYPNAYAHPDGTGSGTSLGAYLVAWQNIAGAPSGTYTLSGRMNSSGGAQQIWIQADNGVFEGRYCNTSPSNTASWIQLSCSFNYTAGNTLHVAMVALNTSPTAWGWVSFDDISLTSSASGGETPPYDLAKYLVRADGQYGPVYHMTSGENMQLQPASGRYYQAKNAHWEELWADSTYVYRFRDTSDANTWYGLYRSGGAVQGDIWINRYVSPGYTLTRTPYIKVYNKAGCTAANGWGSDSSQISFTQYYQNWTSPSGITLQNVIRLQAKHLYNGSLNLWEDYYYAEGYGLVAWYGYNYMTGALTGQGWIDRTTGTTPVREGICTP